MLGIITSASADGITIQDATGALVYANDAAARTCGFDSGASMVAASVHEIMARFEILDEAGSPLPVSELPGRRALLGEREPEAVVRFRLRSGAEERWSLVRATPVFDDRGSVRHVVNVFIDITADRRRRQLQSFLADATKELERSLEWEETLQRVARLAVPVMADWCAVDIVDSDGRISLIAVEHVDPAKAEWARDLRRRFPPKPSDPSGVSNVVRTGVSELVSDITPEMIAAADIGDPALREIVLRMQLSSVVIVPLNARGRTLGALTMVWAESGKHYSDEDVLVAEELASHAAFAIDNARLYRERDHAARSLQERLLPKTLPRIPGVEVAARYLAAGDALQAGGDFYDLFEMDDGSWKAVIGDVCGKGPEAAALMGFVRFTMRAASRQDRKPSEALVKLNRALLEELGAGGSEFCTAAVVRLRPEDGGARLMVAIAGHPLPMIVRADGTVEEVGAPGSLLGVLEEITVSDQMEELRVGDTIVMLTDGVIEASRDESWRSRVIPELLAGCAGLPAGEVADRIEAAVSGLDDRRTDDIAILVIRMHG